MPKPSLQDATRQWFIEALSKSSFRKIDVAKLLGLQPSAITRIIDGKREISLDEFGKLLAFFGEKRELFTVLFEIANVSDIIEGPAAIKNTIAAALSGAAYDINSKHRIVLDKNDVIEINTKAQLVDNETLFGEAFFSFVTEEKMIRAKWSIPDDVILKMDVKEGPDLRILNITDDCMEPTLARGDYVFVDINYKEVTVPGIYAIVDTSNNVYCRRLEITTSEADGRLIRLISDNTRYPVRTERSSGVRIGGKVTALIRLHP